MALDGYNIGCTGCTYSGAVEHSPVRIDYMLPRGVVIHAYRTFAWCFTCEDVVDAEKPLEKDQIEAQVKLYNSFTSGLLYRVCAKLFGRGKATAERLAELEDRLTLAELRESGPRCLSCGETTIVPLRFEKSGISNILHKCGGRLYKADKSDDLGAVDDVFYALHVIRLDHDGRKIPGGEEYI